MKNYGVIIRKPKKTDYVAGLETGILYSEVLPDGNWTSFLPSDESQYNSQFDTMACVSFSAINAIESQCNFLLSKISAENVAKLKQWGYIVNDMFNFSDRAIAKLSGTTHQGNDLGSVIQSVRDYGLVPESMWPFPQSFNWDNYYAEIPQEVKDFGKHILEVFDIKYEWAILDGWQKNQVPTIAAVLKQAPLQVAMPVCPGWGDKSPVPTCPSIQSQHATVLYNLDSSRLYDFDHYPPCRKLLDIDYPVLYGMKIVVSEKKAPVAPEPFLHAFTVDIGFGTRHSEVKWLQKALAYLKNPETGEPFFKLSYQTDYYGFYTQQAVLEFQVAYKLINWFQQITYKGKYCHRITRNKLNELLGG